MGPTGSITNSYQPSPQAQFFGTLLEYLRSHPELGFPGAGALRGPRLLRPIGQEMGGFNVPTSQMRRELNIPTPNRYRYNPPTGEQAVRDEYASTVEGMNQAANHIEQLPRVMQENPMIQKTVRGQAELDRESNPSRFSFSRHN